MLLRDGAGRGRNAGSTPATERTNAVKNAERVFGWNQHPEDQKHMTVNLAFLSLSPLQLFCYNELLRQGRLQPDFLPAAYPSLHRFLAKRRAREPRPGIC